MRVRAHTRQFFKNITQSKDQERYECVVNRESKYVTPHLQLRERLLSSQCNASFYLSGWELLRLLSGKEYTSQIRPLGCNSDFTTYPLCVRRLITQPLCVCFLACKVEILAPNSQIVRKVE